jgi:hypothetical protein
MNDSNPKLLKLIPPIKRARGFYLYTYDGARYVDCWQNNGHAILGHRPEGLTTAIKDVLSKGLVSDLPSVYDKRLKRALFELFPDYRSFLIGASLYDALAQLKNAAGISITPEDIADPVFAEAPNAIASLWRPFLGQDAHKPEIIIPILPFAVAGSPCVICLKERFEETAPVHISPILIAGLTRAIYDLLKSSDRVEMAHLGIDRGKAWTARGIYLIPNFDENAYEREFERFISEGFILSPSYPGPSILPAGLSDGLKIKLIGLLSRNP